MSPGRRLRGRRSGSRLGDFGATRPRICARMPGGRGGGTPSVGSIAQCRRAHRAAGLRPRDLGCAGGGGTPTSWAQLGPFGQMRPDLGPHPQSSLTEVGATSTEFGARCVLPESARFESVFGRLRPDGGQPWTKIVCLDRVRDVSGRWPQSIKIGRCRPNFTHITAHLPVVHQLWAISAECVPPGQNSADVCRGSSNLVLFQPSSAKSDPKSARDFGRSSPEFGRLWFEHQHCETSIDFGPISGDWGPNSANWFARNRPKWARTRPILPELDHVCANWTVWPDDGQIRISAEVDTISARIGPEFSVECCPLRANFRHQCYVEPESPNCTSDSARACAGRRPRPPIVSTQRRPVRAPLSSQLACSLRRPDLRHLPQARPRTLRRIAVAQSRTSLVPSCFP